LAPPNKRADGYRPVKAGQNREVIAFADHWHQSTGRSPAPKKIYFSG
jgi:hypothetical protein